MANTSTTSSSYSDVVGASLNKNAAMVRATAGSTKYLSSVRVSSFADGDVIYGYTSASGGTLFVEEYYYRLGAKNLSGATAARYGAFIAEGTGVGNNLIATASGGLLAYGGTLSGATVADPDAGVFALKGGLVAGYQINSGGQIYAGNVSGTSAGAILTAKGLKDLSGPGVISGGTVRAGGTGYILSGGTDESSVILGEQYVSSGGTTMNDMVSAGGIQNVFTGGSSVNTTVGQGGTLVANSGAIISAPTISNGQVFLNQGAAQFGGVVLAQGHLVVSSGAIVSGASVGSGGTETVMSGGINSGGSVLANGTEIISSGGSADNLSIGSGGSLILEAGALLTGTHLTSGAVVDIDWMEYISGGTVHLNGNTLTVVQGNNTWTTTFSGPFNSSDYFILSKDSDGSTILTFICYLEGTMIRTAAGEKAVEDIRAGDKVATYEEGREVIKTVTWAGEKTARVRHDLPFDRAGYPVCIMADAIAPGVPNTDLFVTPEHCMYLNGKFVPARMLVNNRTIYYDVSANTYKYYHIETESHSVLWANGALSESYLNTGNRREFIQKGNVVRFTGDKALSWHEDAAATLSTACSDIKPIHEQLRERAVSMDVALREMNEDLTEDMDLHLVTPFGHRINVARSTESGRFVFMIPADIDEVRIVSHASRPCDTIGPFVDDRRYLGVLVSNLELWTHLGCVNLNAVLKQEGLLGWNNVEDGSVRWTNGNALVKLAQTGNTNPSILSLEVKAGGPYIRSDRQTRSLSVK